MEAKRDIFGEILPYQSPVHTADELDVIIPILEGISAQYLEVLGEDEYIKYTKNISPVLQYIVGIVNKELPVEIQKVDGRSISSYVQTIINNTISSFNPEEEE